MQRLPAAPISAIDAFFEEVISMPLSVSHKQAVHKVIHCLQFIRDNLDEIALHVDHSGDAGVDSAIMRDDWGTSFHLDNLRDGAAAKNVLSQQVAHVEDILSRLAPIERIEYADLLRYDAKSGCLTHRLEPANNYGDTVLSGNLLDLGKIMTLAFARARHKQCALLEGALNYCRTHRLNECLYNKNVTAITEALLLSYIQEVLLETPEYIPPIPSLDEVRQAYTAMLDRARPTIHLGFHGMVRYHFMSEESADEFITWLKDQTQLQALGIHNALTSFESLHDGSHCYVVRLRQEQFECLTSPSDYIALRHTHDHRVKLSVQAQLIVTASGPGYHQDYAQLIANTTTQDIDSAVMHAESALLLAAKHKLAGDFSALVSKASVTAIERSMQCCDKEGKSPFLLAARHQSKSGFIALVTKLPVSALDQALVKQDNKKENGLAIAFRHQMLEAFKVLVEKASPLVLSEASLLMVNGERLLLTFARYESTFELFSEKLPAETLSSAVINTPLLARVAECLSKKQFIYLIQKISIEALDEALKKYSLRENALTFVVCEEDEAKLTALIEKASSSALCKAVCNTQTLRNILLTHKPGTVYQLLRKLDKPTLEMLTRPAALSARETRIILEYVLHEESWQDAALLDALLNAMAETISNPILHEWLQGGELSPVLQTCLLTYLTPREKSPLEREWCEQFALAPPVVGARMEPIDRQASAPVLVVDVWQQGVASFSAYRAMMKNNPAPDLKVKLQLLLASGKLQSGVAVSYEAYQHSHPSQVYNVLCETVINKAQDTALILKVIMEKRWKEFFNQLADYEFRPRLRAPITNATHKFVHLTGEIIPYQLHQPKNKLPHRYTKKSAGTFLSSHLSNSLFGDQHDFDMVALLFDADKVKLKAMLGRDKGTYNHEWLGSEASTKAYQAIIEKVNYTNLFAFREYVDHESHLLNEVLACYSREALLAIVIPKDTPAARTLARKYFTELKQGLYRIVPILFFDRFSRRFKPYFHEEMVADQSGESISMLAEAEVKLRLLSLKNQLHQKSCWHKHSWLHFFVAQPAQLQPTPTRAAQRIISFIEAAEASGEHGCWNKALKAIKNELNNAITNDHALRHEDTRLLYKDIRQTL